MIGFIHRAREKALPCAQRLVQQFVRREQNQRACHRKLARNVVDRRRVNATVMRLHISEHGDS
jgi:hypothetical protein